MKVIAFPRNPQPYQHLLYREMGVLGATVSFLEGPTGSQTVNILLLPVSLVRARLRGYEAFHLHWVYPFALPGANLLPALRAVMQFWFVLLIAVARGCGLRVVWTAHNLLPHERVFWDDLRARRSLVKRCHGVIVHNEATLRELAMIGARPARAEIIPQPGYAGHFPAEGTRARARTHLGLAADDCVLLFLGRITEYKGLPELVRRFGRLASARPVRLVIAGECLDRNLARVLRELAAQSAHPVMLSFDRVPDDELRWYYGAADCAVLPFTRVTNSASVMLTLSFACPVVVPDLPAFGHLPDGALIRYDGSGEGLGEALESVLGRSGDDLDLMRKTARDYISSTSWARAAERTFRMLAGTS
jgi:glycosyltransferase involved in cell wall biosynthesis